MKNNLIEILEEMRVRTGCFKDTTNVLIYLYKNGTLSRIETYFALKYTNFDSNYLYKSEYSINSNVIPELELMLILENLDFNKTFKEILNLNKCKIYSNVNKEIFMRKNITVGEELVLNYISVAFERENYYICSSELHDKIVFTLDELKFKNKALTEPFKRLDFNEDIEIPYGKKHNLKYDNYKNILNNIKCMDYEDILKLYDHLLFKRYISNAEGVDLKATLRNAVKLRYMKKILNLSNTEFTSLLDISIGKYMYLVRGMASIDDELKNKINDTFSVILENDRKEKCNLTRKIIKEKYNNDLDSIVANIMKSKDLNEIKNLYGGSLFSLSEIENHRNVKLPDFEIIKDNLINSVLLRYYVENSKDKVVDICKKIDISLYTLRKYMNGYLNQTKNIKERINSFLYNAIK